MKRKLSYEINPIGHINRAEYGSELCLHEQYIPGLGELDGFSHLVVLWWAHELDSKSHRSALITRPPYAPGRKVGVFATRSPRRPNPIASTTCAIKDIYEPEGIILVNDIDADDGTPIIDIKPYYPVLDLVPDATVPEWAPDEFRKPYPDEGVGLE
jgi:tRNA-Thr(GGU) m(6)t(6)A37 methyltransferase TsaA